jgi:cytochrome P450
MNQGKLFKEILKPINRPNPYPLYAQLRATPVSKQEDGTYVVSTYREILALLHDPRISSDLRKSSAGPGELDEKVESGNRSRPFIFLDPPDHDRLRRMVMHEFTPERVEGMHDRLTRLVNELLDAKKENSDHAGQLDIVDDFAHPLPVAIISEMLGVPPEDRPRFEAWVPSLVRRLEPAQSVSKTEIEEAGQAAIEMREYLSDLIAARRARPADDLISGLVTTTATTVSNNGYTVQMNDEELLTTTMLLLGAGYETTVNLITNSMLTLLRHPDALAKLRRDPNSVIRTVEEVLRFDPPVHFRIRTTLTDIDIAGVTIPKGATVVLLFASGSRDPARFVEPDRFDPDRTDNQHLGFGGGIHYCVGAPLARLETHVALNMLVRRLVAPRLVTDPPPYRKNASLRGPQHLMVAFDRIER